MGLSSITSKRRPDRTTVTLEATAFATLFQDREDMRPEGLRASDAANARPLHQGETFGQAEATTFLRGPVTHNGGGAFTHSGGGT